MCREKNIPRAGAVLRVHLVGGNDLHAVLSGEQSSSFSQGDDDTPNTLADEEHTMAEMLKDMRYDTAYLGK